MEKSIKKYFPVFALPTLVAFTIGFIIPFIMGIYLSFCEFTTVTDAKFVGLRNYIRIFSDATFTHALVFTALFTVVSVLTINVFAFAIAMLLTKGIRGTNLFRTVFFMPNLIGGIVLGYIWQILLNGILANFGKTLTYSGTYGFWGLVILMNWQQIGYMMIIYISGLNSIPDSLYEAARVDGASEFRTFWQISLPLLAPGIVTTALFTIVATWNNYFLPLIMLKDADWYPLTIGLNQWKDQASTAGGQAIQNLVITGSLITIIPLVIAFLCLQKYWQSGLAAGAVKE